MTLISKRLRGETMEFDQISEQMQKYLNYKEQFKRLEKALTNHFFLEALFIEYAIMEDRAEAILRYENNQISGDRVSIDRKIRKIVKLAEQNNSLVHRYFQCDLLEKALAWKEERNRLIHALMKQSLTTEQLAALAEEGKIITRSLSSKATNYKRAVSKRNEIQRDR